LTGPPGTYFSSKYFVPALFVGVCLITTGPILKYFMTNNYWLALMSNTIAGLCQGFIYPAPSTLAIRFFDKKTIPIILALPPLFTSIGSAFGLWFPQWLMGSTSDPDVIKSNLD
jgi:MFS family permease